MKSYLNALRELYQVALYYRDAKFIFFHGNINLINTKKYNSLYRKCTNAGIELLYYSSEKDKFYFKTKDNVIVQSDSNFYVFLEIFADQIYSLPIQFLQRKFYLFDIGMKRGYASLYFANIENCIRVYGYEICDKTYALALENIALNSTLERKIVSHNFGLSDDNKEIELHYMQGRDYMASVDIDYVKNDKSWIKSDSNNINLIKTEVKKSSNIFEELFPTLESEYLKIMKIDVEGAEYEIFKDLRDNNMIDKFDLIIGECHRSLEELEQYLNDFFCINVMHESNSLVTFCFVNKKWKDLI